MIEVRPNSAIQDALRNDSAEQGFPNVAKELSTAEVHVDPGFEPISMPDSGGEVFSPDAVADVSLGTSAYAYGLQGMPDATYDPETKILRAEIDAEASSSAVEDILEREDVVAVHADAEVALFSRRINSPALGTRADVAKLLGVERLEAEQLDGQGVTVVLVDGGIDKAALSEAGAANMVDSKRSRSFGTRQPSGVAHGTRCAAAVSIAAPQATLIDCAVIGQTSPTEEGEAMHVWLSDVLQTLRYVRRCWYAMPQEGRSLIVSNSWGMIDPTWDLDPADKGNYSDRPEHALNRFVETMVEDGMDVVFAAGNCGAEDPQYGCALPAPVICGANSLESVLTVAGVDVDGIHLPYSSSGPGRIDTEKPDLSGYSHFQGVDGVTQWGTSIAAPVVTGVLAAMRSQWSAGELSSARLRAAARDTAREANGDSDRYQVGAGIIDPIALLTALAP